MADARITIKISERNFECPVTFRPVDIDDNNDVAGLPEILPTGQTFSPNQLTKVKGVNPMTGEKFTPEQIRPNRLVAEILQYKLSADETTVMIPPAALEKLLNCPLTGERLDDPVVAANGVTYERLAIKDYIQKNNGLTPPYKDENGNDKPGVLDITDYAMDLNSYSNLMISSYIENEYKLNKAGAPQRPSKAAPPKPASSTATTASSSSMSASSAMSASSMTHSAIITKRTDEEKKVADRIYIETLTVVIDNDFWNDKYISSFLGVARSKQPPLIVKIASILSNTTLKDADKIKGVKKAIADELSNPDVNNKHEDVQNLINILKSRDPLEKLNDFILNHGLGEPPALKYT